MVSLLQQLYHEYSRYIFANKLTIGPLIETICYQETIDTTHFPISSRLLCSNIDKINEHPH